MYARTQLPVFERTSKWAVLLGRRPFSVDLVHKMAGSRGEFRSDFVRRYLVTSAFCIRVSRYRQTTVRARTYLPVCAPNDRKITGKTVCSLFKKRTSILRLLDFAAGFSGLTNCSWLVTPRIAAAKVIE